MKKNKTNRKFLATAMAAIMVILIFVALTPSTAQTQPMDPILPTKTVEVKPGTNDVDKSIKEVEVKQGTKADVDKSIKEVEVKQGTKADVDKSIKRVEVKQGTKADVDKSIKNVTVKEDTKDVDKSNNKPVKVENGTKDVDKSNKTAKSPGCEDSDIFGTYISEGYDPDSDGCLGSFFLEIDADTPGDDYCDVKAFIQASTGESWWTNCWTIYDGATLDNAFIYFVASEFDISGCEEVTLTIQLYTCDGEYTGSSDTVYVSLDPSEVPPCENSVIWNTYISDGYDPDGDGCLGSFFLEIDADTPGYDQYCDVKAFIQASTGESWWTTCWQIYEDDTWDNAFIYFVASEFDISGCEEVTLTTYLYTCDGEYTGNSDTVSVSLDASEVPPCEYSYIWGTDISDGVDDDSDGCLDSFYLEIDADTPGLGQYCDVKAFIQASTGESWWTDCWMIYGWAIADNAFIYFDASDFATTAECEEVTLTVDLYTCDGEYTESSDTVSVLREYEEPVCEKSYIWNTYISYGVDDDGDGCLESFYLEIDADTPRNDQYCDVRAYIEASTGESWWTTCWEIYDGAISDNAFIHFDASEFDTTTECEEVTLTTYLYTCDGVNTGSTDAVSANVESAPPEIHWTFMVYLDGDNNLESCAIDDFLEMSSVSSTAGVNIVVQFDRIPSYSNAYDDWTTCKRFLVTPGMTPTAANAICDLGECNMGDPNTLDAFVTWAMTNFPADNYALILWNHGDGWKSINNWVPWADDIKDVKDAGLSRGICVDNTDNDYLSLQETEVALTGKYVQLLGYDACLMHMIEVVYQVMTNAGVSVGSEEPEPGDGWPYDTILTDLTGMPTMNEDALGTVIVDRYMDYYGYTGSETQSAVDNSDFSGLVAAVNNLAQVLMNEINGGHVADVQQARNAAEEIYFTYYIDLYHFAQKIKTDVPGATAQAQAVMYEVSKLYEAHGTSVPNDHGLSIYFPRVEGVYLASYENTAFAVDTLWDEFLKKYYNVPEPILCTDPDPPSHGFGSVPEGQTRDWSFDITNCGEGTLTWTVSDDQSWITVTPPSDSTTTETDAVTVSIDTTGLGSGITHTGTVTVSSNGGTKQGLISVYVPEPGTHVAYLKKGQYGAEDHDLYIYTAPTTIGEHGTLIASDYWSPDGSTVGITAIGTDKIAYLKRGPSGDTDFNLFIYTAPTTLLEPGTLIASDYWSPDGSTVGITAIGTDKIAYLKRGPSGDLDFNLFIYTAPSTIGEPGTLIASDYWSPDGSTVGITAIGTDKIAYLKRGPSGDLDFNLFIHTVPTTLLEPGTLIASDYWSPDGSTVGITAVDIDGKGIEEIAYLKRGPYGDTDYDLYIYTAPITMGEHGTLIASDYWSPDGQAEGISALW